MYDSGFLTTLQRLLPPLMSQILVLTVNFVH